VSSVRRRPAPYVPAWATPTRVTDQDVGPNRPNGRIVWRALFMPIPGVSLDGRERWCPHRHRSEDAAWQCRRRNREDWP
jgi:hypothetical protein